MVWVRSAGKVDSRSGDDLFVKTVRFRSFVEPYQINDVLCTNASLFIFIGSDNTV